VPSVSAYEWEGAITSAWYTDLTMSEPETPSDDSVKPVDDAPPKSELFALGCGCLLIVLIFVAAVFAGFQRT
jgi:hypothetical protein